MSPFADFGGSFTCCLPISALFKGLIVEFYRCAMYYYLNMQLKKNELQPLCIIRCKEVFLDIIVIDTIFFTI